MQIKYNVYLHYTSSSTTKIFVNIYGNIRNVKDSKAAEQPAKREKKSIAGWKKVVFYAELAILPRDTAHNRL